MLGSVCYVDDKGRVTQCFTADSAVKYLLYSEGRDMIVVVTDGLVNSKILLGVQPKGCPMYTN